MSSCQISESIFFSRASLADGFDIPPSALSLMLFCSDRILQSWQPVRLLGHVTPVLPTGARGRFRLPVARYFLLASWHPAGARDALSTPGRVTVFRLPMRMNSFCRWMQDTRSAAWARTFVPSGLAGPNAEI